MVSVLFLFGQVVSAWVVLARFKGRVVSAQFWQVVSAHFILYSVVGNKKLFLLDPFILCSFDR